MSKFNDNSSEVANNPNNVTRGTDISMWKNFQYDIPSGIVVFLVALPLCLGIALASAPDHLFSGILAGIIGGLVVPLISRSPLSVSGPAAGLIAIVLTGIETLGGFEKFLVAVMLGGVLQIIMGFLKAGTIAYFFPTSVIKGMLAAIGIILILKQFPHAVGYDVEAFDFSFRSTETENTFSLLLHSFSHIQLGALIISVISLAILVFWERTRLKDVNWLPAALIVVIFGIIINEIFLAVFPDLALYGGEEGHLVNLPETQGFSGFISQLTFPDWSVLSDVNVYVTALTLGIVASVESLLSVEAVDKLDPHKRVSPLNRELLAQGVGNMLAGLIGALPVTTVIVRSSANVNSGGQTRMAAIAHGIFLFVSVITIGSLLNKIPVASLASILLLIGYKLARPSLFKQMYKGGWNQIVPFVVTIIAVVATDLLKGIAIGTLVGIFYTIRSNFHSAITVKKESDSVLINFNKDVSFMNKVILRGILDKIKYGSNVIIDGTAAEFIDNDIKEMISEYKVRSYDCCDIKLDIRGVSKEIDTIPPLNSTLNGNRPQETTSSSKT